ncbi:hypothetical protein [Peribacillus simplex]|uniref:hypothetical protein n=1 Tax=Peribacillus simplex TaxID=1478 RepID=UPI0020418700|nr:hypothetical protein [Peribacillus simplex]
MIKDLTSLLVEKSAKEKHRMLWTTSGRKILSMQASLTFVARNLRRYPTRQARARNGRGHLFSIPASNPIKNQKGFGMKRFRNLFVYKLKHPYRMYFFLQSLIAEFLQLGIGAEPSGMPL